MHGSSNAVGTGDGARAGRGRHRRRLRPGPRRVVEPAQPGDRRPCLRHDARPRSPGSASRSRAGLARGGVVPCGKHFPGHGDTVGDSHHVLPRVTPVAAHARADRPGAVRARDPGARSGADDGARGLRRARPAAGRPRSRRASATTCCGAVSASAACCSATTSRCRRSPDGARRSAPRWRRSLPAATCCWSASRWRWRAARCTGSRRRSRGTLDAADVVLSLARIQGLRRRHPRRRTTARAALRWPKHAALAARLRE